MPDHIFFLCLVGLAFGLAAVVSAWFEFGGPTEAPAAYKFIATAGLLMAFVGWAFRAAWAVGLGLVVTMAAPTGELGWVNLVAAGLGFLIVVLTTLSGHTRMSGGR